MKHMTTLSSDFLSMSTSMTMGMKMGIVLSPFSSPNSQKKILEIIENNPNVTRKEIASTLGLSVIGTRYHLNRMKDAGLIRYVGTSRKGHWEILKDLPEEKE